MIRKIRETDRSAYLAMAGDFYSSAAVCSNVPRRHLTDAFDEMMRSDRYIAGYILECEERTAGYALLAKSFSQEAGGMVVWIDELYVIPEYRCRGLGSEFFDYVKSRLPDGVKRLRLEVERDNGKAISLYRRLGFEDLPYSQMIADVPGGKRKSDA